MALQTWHIYFQNSRKWHVGNHPDLWVSSESIMPSSTQSPDCRKQRTGGCESHEKMMMALNPALGNCGSSWRTGQPQIVYWKSVQIFPGVKRCGDISRGKEIPGDSWVTVNWWRHWLRAMVSKVNLKSAASDRLGSTMLRPSLPCQPLHLLYLAPCLPQAGTQHALYFKRNERISEWLRWIDSQLYSWRERGI